MPRVIPKSAVVTTGNGVINADVALYTPALLNPQRSLLQRRKFTSNYILIYNTEAGGNRVRIWNGPSATGVLVYDNTLAATTGVILGPNFNIDFTAQITVQVTVGAVRGADITIQGFER